MLAEVVLVISLLTQENAGEDVMMAESACPNGFFSLGDGCYYYYDITETYDEARAICQLLPGDNVDLAVFDTHAGDATFLSTFAINNDISTLWVGGTDQGHDGYWTWVDGRPLHLEAPYWNSTAPRGGTSYNCATLTKVTEKSVRIRLIDSSCTTVPYPFICQLGLNPLK